jgi:hypothetical protein
MNIPIKPIMLPNPARRRFWGKLEYNTPLSFKATCNARVKKILDDPIVPVSAAPNLLRPSE